MASPMGVVVWEWLNAGSWLAFHTSLSDNIDIQYVAWGNGRGGGSPIIPLGNFDGTFQDCLIDFQKNIQVNTNISPRFTMFGPTQMVRRSIYPMNSPPAIGIEWQWHADIPGQWGSYNMPVQCYIEEARNMGMLQVDLSLASDPLSYIIDFTTMCQINHSTRFARRIQRAQIAWKYTQMAPLPSTYTTGLIPNIATSLPQSFGQFTAFASNPHQFGFQPAPLNQGGLGGIPLPHSLLSNPFFISSAFNMPTPGSGGFNYTQMNLNTSNMPTHFQASMMANLYVQHFSLHLYKTSNQCKKYKNCT